MKSDKKSNILNQDFRKTYHKYLEYLLEVPEINVGEMVVLVYYLLL